MTDRALRTPDDLSALAFDGRGLVPVVTQDAARGAVLMVAWADREALERSLATGLMHYWSRSRGELWKKGETSGNLQHLVSLHADCDADTVLARVRMEGPSCHTGEATCFGELEGEDPGTGDGGPDATGRTESKSGSAAPVPAPDILTELWSVLEGRNRERPEGSYTTRLLSDENLRLKKLGEETVELVTALVRGDERTPEEAADLLYHLLVALMGAGHDWEEVARELRKRRG